MFHSSDVTAEKNFSRKILDLDCGTESNWCKLDLTYSIHVNTKRKAQCGECTTVNCQNVRKIITGFTFRNTFSSSNSGRVETAQVFKQFMYNRLYKRLLFKLVS